MDNSKICFIGAGHIAKAIIAGLTANDYESHLICATRRSDEKLAALKTEYKIETIKNNVKAAENSDILILSVPPSEIKTVCLELSPLLKHKKKLVISLAAGMPIRLLEKWLDPTVPIIRAMPNLPAIVGAGITGLFASASVEEQQKIKAESIFRSIGITIWVDHEDQIDVITALSGSGPGYIFLIMKTIQDTAQSLGLSAEVARLLTTQLVMGSSRLAMENEKEIKELLASVATPNGATAAAIEYLEKNNLESILAKAIYAAWERTKALTAHLEQ